ncbi:unnamed protein product [Callosobruchus maculatus]|uniref:RING-type domain-containing protein n=1 Tax=Callosobruchus maculatus TaxID=64391 RepID=A0A653D3D8_CALMS|nr:unnamed protein product [Callosobruchus maculatus]
MTENEKKISSSQVLETKCEGCDSVCSVAPVSEDEGGYYCGRCRPEEPPDPWFEEAAKKVLFPCKFGCADMLAWGQAEVHEVYCKNRAVVCPYANCTDECTFSALHAHMKAIHGEFYQKEPKKNQVNLGALNLIVRLNCIAFDKFVLLFFVKLEHKSDTLNFNYSVLLVWPQDYEETELDNIQLRLEIEVPRLNLNVTKLIHSKEIVNYHDRLHCVNCLYQTCDKSSHTNKCDWVNHKIPLNVGHAKERNLFYTVTVYKTEGVSRKAPDNVECPVCMDYMTGTIYLCENGHSLCGECKEKQTLENCPLCRGKLLNIRNFAMESLLTQMTISCRRKFSGCTFVGLVGAVKTHEVSCKYP